MMWHLLSSYPVWVVRLHAHRVFEVGAGVMRPITEEDEGG